MSGKRKSFKSLMKPTKLKKPLPLPSYVRNELRMTCAMKGYSGIKTGKSMRLPDQYAAMDKYFHCKTPTHPPQIKLLAEGHVNYSALYNEVDVTIKKTKGV